MTTEGREVVRVEGLVKEFRPGLGLRAKRVLDGITFSVQENEIFGLVGPNGAGKTTMLKTLMGLIRPTAGTASILGHDIQESGFRKHVGFLPEVSYFYDYLTGVEFLDFYAKLSGVPRADRPERIATLLGWVGLSHAGDARLRTYSKGMLQRAGIAQALIHDPQIVFLDEPMSGLDPLGRKEIRDLILRLRSDGKTVFMNTHILSDVEMVCDRVAIIVEGKIRYEGQIEHFISSDQQRADVVLANVSAELASTLEERFRAELRDHGQQVEARVPEKIVSDLLRACLEAGAQVLSVTPVRVSLESIFLETVEETTHAREQEGL
ncbi:MAG: ABC transporter ATP-binding protein [Deltaproteobacteria bacterium]|nr:ABC transporter ATP-binding protein [Deltaproteobacteria bacterium]